MNAMLLTGLDVDMRGACNGVHHHHHHPWWSLQVVEPDVRLATLLDPYLECLDPATLASIHDVIVVELPMESDPKKGDDETTPPPYQYSSPSNASFRGSAGK